jgi:hypothetical protein
MNDIVSFFNAGRIQSDRHSNPTRLLKFIAKHGIYVARCVVTPGHGSGYPGNCLYN